MCHPISIPKTQNRRCIESPDTIKVNILFLFIVRLPSESGHCYVVFPRVNKSNFMFKFRPKLTFKTKPVIGLLKGLHCLPLTVMKPRHRFQNFYCYSIRIPPVIDLDVYAKSFFFKRRSNFKVEVTKSKIVLPNEKILPQVLHMCSMNVLLWKVWPMLQFFKSRSNLKGMVPCEMARQNTHVQYESHISPALKVIVKVKVCQSRSNIKVKITRLKVVVSFERSYHKE